MAVSRSVASAEILMGRLDFGADLLQGLTDMCIQKSVRLGRMEALGAVQKARLGFYDQKARQYRYVVMDKPLELLHLVGNVSLKDGKPMVHAHVTLADDEGHAFGGHLASGTIVFSCEYVIEEFNGPTFARGLDQETGLPLWIAQ